MSGPTSAKKKVHIECNRLRVISQALPEMSIPIQFLLSFFATETEVPDPHMGSRNKSPGREEALMIRSKSFSGF